MSSSEHSSVGLIGLGSVHPTKLASGHLNVGFDLCVVIVVVGNGVASNVVGDADSLIGNGVTSCGVGVGASVSKEEDVGASVCFVASTIGEGVGLPVSIDGAKVDKLKELELRGRLSGRLICKLRCRFVQNAMSSSSAMFLVPRRVFLIDAAAAGLMTAAIV